MSKENNQDPIDRDCYLARSGKPHNPAIAHLQQTHNLPATAKYLLESVKEQQKDKDTGKILANLQKHRDNNPKSPTFACYKWYMEDEAVYDTNAAFFICTPLAGLWLAHKNELNQLEQTELKKVFTAVLPWFRKMASEPSFYYPNKCISDGGMLLATGHILENRQVIEEGRDLSLRYLDYYERRGTGWGEDHSPGYVTVILEMTLLMMALEKNGMLARKARRMTDAIMEWVVFHNGIDAVPSIRGYNFEAAIEKNYAVHCLLRNPPATRSPQMLKLLKKVTGYSFPEISLPPTRQRRWRTFDQHYSTTYITPHARLGTLSQYPLMPNTYMHDTWGLGWQTKPCSFIVDKREYGFLQWITKDDQGVVRQHQTAAKGMHDWASRSLFKRLSFHPEVCLTAHQDQGAAIVFQEIHQLHSSLQSLHNRWRLAHGAGQVWFDGKLWQGPKAEITAQWIVLQYQNATVAIHPLQARGLDEPDTDQNPQRRMTGKIESMPVLLEKDENGISLSIPLIDNHDGTVIHPLCFSGWCIVMLEQPEEIKDLSLTENFYRDGELPRTYGELIRRVELTTPYGQLALVRDMLTGDTQRFINGQEFSGIPESSRSD